MMSPMHRPGADPDNMRMEDVLCDFCGAEWIDSVPMVEGHHGSCICGNCLRLAYRAVVLERASDGIVSGVEKCTLCLEKRDETGWLNTARPGAIACRRCINQSAGALQKDKEMGWRKPVE